MFTCFLIISMNSSKSSFPFPLTSYSMTRLSTCRLIWDKLEAKTLIGFRLQLWAITILHQSHHHLPISRQNEERSRKRNPPRPRSGFAPSTSWLAAALSLILSHFDPSNNCEGRIIAKERFFLVNMTLAANLVTLSNSSKACLNSIVCNWAIESLCEAACWSSIFDYWTPWSPFSSRTFCSGSKMFNLAASILLNGALWLSWFFSSSSRNLRKDCTAKLFLLQH